MKYSIILPYYYRPVVYNTLMTFRHFYGSRQDVEVILLEDKKNVVDDHKHSVLLDILKDFNNDLNIVHKEMSYDNYACPCSSRNYGAEIARGRFIVLTSPECAHEVDILKGCDEEFDKNEDVYIVCACMLVKSEVDNAHRFEDFKYIKSKWYQHSTHNPRSLHFCNVISKDNYIKIGGFNEDFDKGISRDDVNFVHRAARFLPFVTRDDLVSLHQDHGKDYCPKEDVKKLVSVNYSCKTFKSRFYDRMVK